MFEPVSTKHLTSLPRPYWRCIVLADLHFHAGYQLLDTGVVDNDTGPSLGPLVRSAFISLVVTQIWSIARKCPGSPLFQQFLLPTFLGPHELTYSIPGWALRAGCSSVFIKTSIRCLCPLRSFFILNNILLMDESRISRSLSETSAPMIIAVSWPGLRR